MEASHLRLRGDDVDRFAETLVESKATESARSINKRGVRNIHRFEGEGFTQLAYERGSAHDPSWVMVSVLVEQVDDRTCTVVVLVGGGGRGPFKFEDVSLKRVFEGEGSVGQAGRFATVLKDVDRAAESLDLDVETRWQADTASTLTERLEAKIFHS